MTKEKMTKKTVDRGIGIGGGRLILVVAILVMLIDDVQEKLNNVIAYVTSQRTKRIKKVLTERKIDLGELKNE